LPCFFDGVGQASPSSSVICSFFVISLMICNRFLSPHAHVYAGHMAFEFDPTHHFSVIGAYFLFTLASLYSVPVLFGFIFNFSGSPNLWFGGTSVRGVPSPPLLPIVMLRLLPCVLAPPSMQITFGLSGFSVARIVPIFKRRCQYLLFLFSLNGLPEGYCMLAPFFLVSFPHVSAYRHPFPIIRSPCYDHFLLRLMNSFFTSLRYCSFHTQAPTAASFFHFAPSPPFLTGIPWWRKRGYSTAPFNF